MVETSAVSLQHLSLEELPQLWVEEGTGHLSRHPLSPQSRSLSRREQSLLDVALDYLQTPSYAEQSGLDNLQGYWSAIVYLSQAELWHPIYQDLLLRQPDPSHPASLHETLNQLKNFAEQLSLYKTLLQQLGQSVALVCLHGLGRGHYYRSQYAQANTYYNLLLEQAQQQQNFQAQQWALEGLANVALALQQFEQALPYAQALMGQVRLSGRPVQLASALRLLGDCYRAVGFKRQQFQQALDCYQEALALVMATGDRNLEGLILMSLTTIHLDLLALTAAQGWLDRFRSISHQISYSEVQLVGQMNLARHYMLQKHYSIANPLLLQALQISRSQGDLCSEVQILQFLSASYARSADYQAGIDVLVQALPLTKRLQRRENELVSHVNLAYCYSRSHQLRRARRQALQAYILSRRVQEPILKAMGLAALACTDWYGGRRGRALYLIFGVSILFLQHWHWEGAQILVEKVVGVISEPLARRWQRVRHWLNCGSAVARS